jgi:hypothetical protein
VEESIGRPREKPVSHLDMRIGVFGVADRREARGFWLGVSRTGTQEIPGPL